MLSAVNGYEEEQTLNDFYNILKSKMSKFEANVNFECVEEKLNLMKYGSKIMGIEKAGGLILNATNLCSDRMRISKRQDLESMKSSISQYPTVVNCMKLKLIEDEPNSPLLDNFEANLFDNFLCKFLHIKELITDMIQGYRTIVQLTFGNASLNCYNIETEKRQITLLVVLSGETRPDVQNEAIEKYLNNQQLQYDAIFECLMESDENM